MPSPQDFPAPPAQPPEQWYSPWSLDELPDTPPRPAPLIFGLAHESPPSVAQPAAAAPVLAPLSSPAPLPVSPAIPARQQPPQPSASVLSTVLSTSPPRQRMIPPQAAVPQRVAAVPVRPVTPQPQSIQQAQDRVTKSVPFSADEFARQQRLRWMVPMALVTFVFTVGAWVYLQDDALPYDGELAMSPVDITSPAPNAESRLRAVLSNVKAPPPTNKDLNAPWTWDTPSLSITTNSNALAFEGLRDLLGERDWHPQRQAWFMEDLGSHSAWEHLSAICGIASAYHHRLAQEPIALRQVLDMADLSLRLEQVTAWPTYYARGVELHQHACEAAAHLLTHSTLDARALLTWQAEWERCQPVDLVFAEAFKGFYEFERKLIVGPRAGDPWDSLTAALMPQRPGKFFFKPNRTLSLFTLSFLEMKEAARQPAYLRTTQIVARVGEPDRPASSVYGPNHVGMTYANERIWPYVNLMERHSLERARHLLVFTLFAVRRWGADYARAPASLEELVPHYVTALPIDPFSGKPLRYDAKKGLIYSVGIDFRDSGGAATDVPLENAAEPTVSIR